MATLNSPGVSVTIENESTYSSGSAGTIPFIVVSTRRNKVLPNGEIASGTTQAAMGRVHLTTGKNDFERKFGKPKFRSINGRPIHGDETNEYGLLAAWRALDTVGQAYILPVNLPLDELTGSAKPPVREPEDGTHWLDIGRTNIGLFVWNTNTNAWEQANVNVLNDEPGTGNVQPVANGIADPRDTYGLNGDYAIVTSISPLVVWQKISGTWIMIGSESHPNDFQFSPHIRIPNSRADGTELQNGDMFIKTTTPNGGTQFDISRYNQSTGNFSTKQSALYMNNDDATQILRDTGNLERGSVYVQIDHEGKLNPYYNYNISRPQYSDGVAVFTPKIYTGDTAVTASSRNDIPNINLSNYPQSIVKINGVDITLDSSVSTNGTEITASDIINHLQSSVDLASRGLRFNMNGDSRITIINTRGYDITVQNIGEVGNDWTPNTMTDVAAVLGFRYNVSTGKQMFRESNWETLSFVASNNAPSRPPMNGTLWYSTDPRVEILKSHYDTSKNQMVWRTYAWSEGNGTNGLSNNVYIRGVQPTEALEGDLWLDSTDLDNYPVIYQMKLGRWVKKDNTDQTTSNGILFSNYSYSDPFTNSGVPRSQSQANEFAPNPDLYPEGILLFNMDYSTFNVKEHRDGEWIAVSGTKPDGSPYMGRKAQRNIVVTAMRQAISNSREARSDTRFFNLISAPGYIEVLPELNALNSARKLTSFVVTGAPLRLPAIAQDVQEWATNHNNSSINGEDGLVTFNDMSAVYAFGGLQSDADGMLVSVPADSLALDTILRNDQQSYPWYAPAGTTRGTVYNTTMVGYVDNGEFINAQFEGGIEDVMYMNKVNPIKFFPNDGIYIFGQKTLAANSTAMDRVNVARLTAYLRYNLDRITRPFLFEQNNTQTRSEAQSVVEQFLSDLVDKNAIYDFVVDASEAVNTPQRIDRNELYIEIGIAPQKSIEFIYIPIRLQNTGAL